MYNINYMDGNRQHFYFAIALVAITAMGGFVMLEVADTITSLALIEGSFYSVVRNGDVRLSAEIGRSIEEIDLDAFEKGFEEIDSEINGL